MNIPPCFEELVSRSKSFCSCICFTNDSYLFTANIGQPNTGNGFLAAIGLYRVSFTYLIDSTLVINPDTLLRKIKRLTSFDYPSRLPLFATDNFVQRMCKYHFVLPSVILHIQIVYEIRDSSSTNVYTY